MKAMFPNVGNLLSLLLLLGGAVCQNFDLDYDEPCTARWSDLNSLPEVNKGHLVNQETTEPIMDYCNFEKGYECHTELNVCRCLNETEMIHVYNETNNFYTCESFIGGQCGISIPWNYAMLPCLDENAECFNDRCECTFNYRASEQAKVGPDVKCLGDIVGVSCNDSSIPCHPETNMICHSDRCQCPHPYKQYFDYDNIQSRKCVGIVGMPGGCNPDEAGQCEDAAFCGADGKCQCSPGYSINRGLPPSCRKHYGTDCNAEDYEDSCNYARGLSCQLGKCQCEGFPDVHFDMEMDTCVINEGGLCNVCTCDPIPPALVGDLFMKSLPCAPGLICNKVEKYAMYGICEKIIERV